MDSIKHRNKKLTQEEFEKYCKKYNTKLTPVGKYIDSRTPVECKCNFCGAIKTYYPNNIYSNNGCRICSAKARCITEGEYKNSIVKIFGENQYELIHLNKDDGCKGYSIVKHLVCGNEYPVTMDAMINGKRGCPHCSNHIPHTEERILERLSTLPDIDKYHINKIYRTEKYGRLRWVCSFTHKDCGTEFEMLFDSFYHQGCRCPKCMAKISLGAEKVKEVLLESGYDFVKEKKFPDCKDVRLLPFDFYIPDLNLVIEYDGEQHFKPNGQYGEKIDSTQKHDNMKNAYCQEHGIDLLRISYTQFDMIESILKSKLAKER